MISICKMHDASVCYTFFAFIGAIFTVFILAEQFLTTDVHFLVSSGIFEFIIHEVGCYLWERNDIVEMMRVSDEADSSRKVSGPGQMGVK